jgi:PAS domain S-box-containing protein
MAGIIDGQSTPVTSDAGGGVADLSGDAGSDAVDRFSVLLVDDDVHLCDSLSSLLRVVDYEVVNVYSGEEALAASLEHRFDAAIIDVNLPDIDGVEVLRALRRADPGLGALMLSGSATLEHAVESVNSGADAFILKPAKPEVIISRLVNVVVRKRLERELRVSEANYRGLFENIGDGAFQADREGNYTSMNRSGAEILGFEGPDAILEGELRIGDTYISRDEMEILHAKVIREGQIRRVLRRFRRQDGTLGWLETSVSTRRGAGGAVVGFEGVFRDVTDRVRYQETLEGLFGLWADLGDVDSLEEVSDLTLEFLRAMLGIEMGSFYVLVERLLRRVGIGVGGVEPNELPLTGGSMASLAVRAGTSKMVHDTREDPDLPEACLIGNREIMSILAVPVKMDDEVVAVIEVGSTRTAAFSEEDRKLVEIIAEHIGSSLGRLMRNRFGLKPNNGLRDFM